MVSLVGFAVGHEQTIRVHSEAKAHTEPVNLSLAGSCDRTCSSIYDCLDGGIDSTLDYFDLI